MKIGLVVAERFGRICSKCRLIQKGAFVTLVISRLTGPIFIKSAEDVGKILQLNTVESEWRYCNPFWNAAVPNECIYRNFAIKLVAMATSLEELEKEVRIDIFTQMTII